MKAQRNAATKAWEKMKSAPYKARKNEEASKKALAEWCDTNGWKVIFFEGRTGAPRTDGQDRERLVLLGSQDGTTVLSRIC